jgi:hypothetical protein
VRTYVYIDGFNLYYGSVEGTNLKWLDLVGLCRLLLPKDTIERVHYCTALTKDPPHDPNKSVRQQMFIRALETFPEVSVTYGSFLANKKKMPLAAGNTAESADPSIATLVPGGPRSAIVLRTEEKGSDVNLATLMVADAFKGNFEAAVVLSTDSDLALPVKLIREELGLPVGVLFPSGRYSVELAQVASFKRTIQRSHLRKCQLPVNLFDANGVITKPSEWMSTYAVLEDKTGVDLGRLTNPSPSVDAGEIVALDDGRKATVVRRVETEGHRLEALLTVTVY